MKKGGGGKKLPAKLQAMVDKDLGGYDKMRADFVQAGVTQFGSGWAWIIAKDGKLAISKSPNGENPLMHGASPILGVRRVGAQLLHRLPQRAPEVPGSLVR
jgi:Fe-Mn family superoxide dismutase